MKSFINTFLRDESGASAAEYALILAVVGVAIGAGALALGQNVGVAITKSSDKVRDCGTLSDGTAPGDYVDVPADCAGAAPAP